jgi:hypothetical protein
MNSYPLLILLLLLAVLIVSIVRILRLPFPKTRRSTLSSIRVLLILFIAIAFFEPSFKFERLPPQIKNIPVLIDNSKSMGLFSPDSTVIPFINTLQKLNKKSSIKNKQFVFYTFGDSLKKVTDSLTFSDSKSTFPPITGNSSIDKSPSMIIISDANWSNSVQLSSMIENKSLYYLRLPKPHKSDHFYTNVKSAPASSKDSTHFTCNVNGFTTDSLSLTLRCATYNINLYQKTYVIKPGNVQESFDFNLKKLAPGIHVLRFQTLVGDSIVSEYRHVQIVSKDIFYYRTQFTTASLDNRFLQLAFSRDSSFVATSSDTADLLIISDYKTELSSKLSSVSKNGLLFFAGTLPCQPLKQSTTDKLIADFSSWSGFNISGTASLPPISVYNNCLSSSAVRIFAWVSSGQEHADTFPALFTTIWKNNTALILGLKNFWKWDFYPLVSDLGEENTFTFSRRIVNVVKELLSFQSSSGYTTIVNNDVTDSDPFSIDHYLPQSVGFDDRVTISCTVKRSDNVTLLDSSITTIHDGTGKIHTAFKAVSSGNYKYTTTIRNGNELHTYTDSVHINIDNSEFSITGQNEYIFSDIAQPIIQTDTASLERILNESDNVVALPIKQSVTLNRNWLLILLILATYGVELFLRRRWKLD